MYSFMDIDIAFINKHETCVYADDKP